MNFEVVVVIVVLVIAVIWLICREFFCWYWKINERRDLLFSINEKLAAISVKLNCESSNQNSSSKQDSSDNKTNE